MNCHTQAHATVWRRRHPLRSHLLAGGFGLLLLAGCAGGVSQRDAANFGAALAVGDYPVAAQLAMTSGGIAANGQSNNLVWSLNAGAALVHAGEPPRAIQVFDGAEALMKSRDLSTIDTQYDYATYDGVMVNAYKALAFLGAGDKPNARVEFNRVGERQERAEEEFAQEKAKLDQQARERAGGAFDLGAAMKGAQENADYRAVQAELGPYASYRPFINPAASYLRALYLINNAETASDLERARVELLRVRDMAGASPVVQADLALLASVRKGVAPMTWVVFENGRAPSFAQYNMTLPVPVFGKGGHVSASTVTVGMPRMVFHAPAAGRLAVLAGGAESWTASIGDFDRVMASEFQRRQPAIMTRVVVEAALKAGLQSAVAQTGHGLLQLAAAVAANIPTADTRSWSALPKGFQAARVNAPQDGVLRLRTDTGQELGSVRVPTDRGSIVYVKSMTAGGRPSLQVFPL